MSEPLTYVKPWATAADPVMRELWAQYAGMTTDETGERPKIVPAYSYYLHGTPPHYDDCVSVTGILASMGLKDPVTGLDRGVSPPVRPGGTVPPMPAEPRRPRPTDKVQPDFPLIPGTGFEEEEAEPEPR